MPPYIPPKIKTGINNAGTALIVFLVLCRTFTLSSRGSSKISGNFRDIRMLITHNRKVTSSPGPNVAKNEANIDVFVTQPNTIIVTLGGINNPNTEELAINAAAYPRG